MRFAKDFIFGAATSACQVEGAARLDGKGCSIWDTLAEKKGSILDGSSPEIACDQYHRFSEDIAILKELGVNSYRFSFAWSRILPNGTGVVNEKGLDYYKRLVDTLLNNGIIPNATLYHWDLPEALDQKGGWCSRDIVNWYGEYASLLFRTFGQDIPMWATVNEPIATYVGYSGGPFAPARGNEATGRMANHHILLAHGEAVRRFRQENLNESQIGIVVDIWHHHPLRSEHEGDCALAELENEKSYRSYLNPIFRGCYTEPLLHYMEQNKCMPDIREGDMELIHQPIDFFGLNCYNRVVDCTEPELLKTEKEKITGGNFLDNGAEYYPKAVYDAAHILNDEYKIGIPIYITENGTQNCNEEIVDGKIHDKDRIRYMEGFLAWISKAIEDGIDIRGYYAWSLLDNWEWTAGYSLRFGMVHVDYETQKRILKDSAIWYKEMIAKNRALQDCHTLCAPNPILPEDTFVPDVEAHVWEDGRLYFYGSYDIPGAHTYCSDCYHVYSSDNLQDWIDHGVAFSLKDAPWTEGSEALYAPDCAYKDGKYYLYYCIPDGRCGVAVSETPYGPFQDLGQILHVQGIDPAVLIDTDGTAYLYWGQFDCVRGAKLKDNMIEIDPDTITQPLSVAEHEFHEGSSVKKVNGRYYYLFTDTHRHGGRATSLGYAVSDNPLQGFTYGGIIIDNFGCDPCTWNNHGSIQYFRGQWYVFYHRSTHASEYSRHVCAEPIYFDENGMIPEVLMSTSGMGGALPANNRISAAMACELHGNVFIAGDESLDYALVLKHIKNGDNVLYRDLAFDGESEFSVLLKTDGPCRVELYLDGYYHKSLMAEKSETYEVWSTFIAPKQGKHTVSLRFYGTFQMASLAEFTFRIRK